MDGVDGVDGVDVECQKELSARVRVSEGAVTRTAAQRGPEKGVPRSLSMGSHSNHVAGGI